MAAVHQRLEHQEACYAVMLSGVMARSARHEKLKGLGGSMHLSISASLIQATTLPSARFMDYLIESHTLLGQHCRRMGSTNGMQLAVTPSAGCHSCL